MGGVVGCMRVVYNSGVAFKLFVSHSTCRMCFKTASLSLLDPLVDLIKLGYCTSCIGTLNFKRVFKTGTMLNDDDSGLGSEI